MKKRNLKLIALGLTGLMDVAALTGCGSSKEKSATVRIHFYGRSDGCTFGTVSEG